MLSINEVSIFLIFLLALIYTLEKFFKEIVYNGILGLIIRGTEISEGCYIRIPDEGVNGEVLEGKVIGQNICNTKILTEDDGVVHIYHDKIFGNNTKVWKDIDNYPT